MLWGFSLDHKPFQVCENNKIWRPRSEKKWEERKSQGNVSFGNGFKNEATQVLKPYTHG
jgi:hypothetical protein